MKVKYGNALKIRDSFWKSLFQDTFSSEKFDCEKNHWETTIPKSFSLRNIPSRIFFFFPKRVIQKKLARNDLQVFHLEKKKTFSHKRSMQKMFFEGNIQSAKRSKWEASRAADVFLSHSHTDTVAWGFLSCRGDWTGRRRSDQLFSLLIEGAAFSFFFIVFLCYIFLSLFFL